MESGGSLPLLTGACETKDAHPDDEAPSSSTTKLAPPLASQSVSDMRLVDRKESLGAPTEGYFPPELTRVIDAQCAKLMDLTIGRYQVLAHDPRLVHEFLEIAQEDIKRHLQYVARRAQRAMVPPEDRDPDTLIRLMRDDLLEEKANFAELKAQNEVLLDEVRHSKIRLSAMEGQLVRREAQLTEQRTAFLNELMLLKEQVFVLQYKGVRPSTTVDLYSWNEDPLAEEVCTRPPCPIALAALREL